MTRHNTAACFCLPQAITARYVDSHSFIGTVNVQLIDRWTIYRKSIPGRVKTFYINYRDIFTRAFKLALISRDTAVDKKVEKDKKATNSAC